MADAGERYPDPKDVESLCSTIDLIGALLGPKARSMVTARLDEVKAHLTSNEMIEAIQWAVESLDAQAEREKMGRRWGR